MVRSTDFIGLTREIWYKIGAILFIALIITAVAFKIAKSMQQDPPPHAETFSSESTCKAEVSDEHGCYPSKGEDWCAAKGACINRKEEDLMDDDAFSKQCSVQPEVDETPKDPTLSEEITDMSKSETCCMNGKSEEEIPPPTPPKEPSCNTCTKPPSDCPKTECPKPVYCPPCPKCPPPCPRMCPDLSKYVLKTSVPPCPEPKVDMDIYMLKSKCKQPDMSKYVLKTSVPSFKSTPCPPCICKCDGSTNDQSIEDDIEVNLNTDTSSADVVPPEEALGGKRDQSEASAAFDDSSTTAPIETVDNSSTTAPIETESKPKHSQSSSTSWGKYGGFGGDILGNDGLAQSSAKANFEGTCHADSQTVNGYSIQPVIEN